MIWGFSFGFLGLKRGRCVYCALNIWSVKTMVYLCMCVVRRGHLWCLVSHWKLDCRFETAAALWKDIFDQDNQSTLMGNTFDITCKDKSSCRVTPVETSHELVWNELDKIMTIFNDPIKRLLWLHFNSFGQCLTWRSLWHSGWVSN